MAWGAAAGTRRARALASTAGALALLVLLAAAPALAQVERGLVEQGRGLFATHGCYGCHMVGKSGTPIGPDLSRVGGRYPQPYLLRWLRDPGLQKPGAHMPKIDLTEAEVRAIAAYLGSLR